MARNVPDHPVRRRAIAVLAVLALHLAAGALLWRAFAPQWPAVGIARDALVAVHLSPPAPVVKQVPRPVRRSAPRPRAAAGVPAARATPRVIAAPRPPVALSRQTAPVVAASGAADNSGARDKGEGSGASGQGQGRGAGGSGDGSGGGGAVHPPVKIAGDIVSARDYPRAGRQLRDGTRTVIALTVGVDGIPTACSVLVPSPDPDAGPVTCKLAMERFRFRPATDAQGRPVVARFGWQQRWYH